MKMHKRFKNPVANQNGSSSFIIICTVIVVIVAAAFITDIGYMAIERYKLNKHVELIASVGAQKLVYDTKDSLTSMREYAGKNITDIDKLDINISENNRELSVYISKPIHYIFLKTIGFKTKTIKSGVTCKLSNIVSMKGVRPLGIMSREVQYGKNYTLYLNSAHQEVGTNGDLAVDILPLQLQNGNMETDIAYGYPKTLHVGDMLDIFKDGIQRLRKEDIDYLVKKCKHSPTCRFDRYESNCSRIIVLPVLRHDSSGKGEKLLVDGFAPFFIEESIGDKRSFILKGKFIRYMVNSTSSDGIHDYGLIGIKLIHF